MFFQHANDDDDARFTSFFFGCVIFFEICIAFAKTCVALIMCNNLTKSEPFNFDE